MKYKAFDKQIHFHKSNARVRGAFAGKRGGKTESGAIEAIRFCEQQIGYDHSPVDPYLGLIVAPTFDMLRRLSMKKFLAYGKGFLKPGNEGFNTTRQEATWHNDSQIYGISAEKPGRMEGLKANWIWIDEVFQCTEQVFLEAQARLSDTQGYLWCTGSLGVQYTNPKAHWAYKYFKEKPMDGSACFEWTTADNPYFPRAELLRMRENLSPRVYRQMFELDWDVPGTNLVYDSFEEANVLKSWQYDPRLQTFISIDWGWSHPMAVGFFQVDPRDNRVVLFDEIVSSRLKLEGLWDLIQAKVQSWGPGARIHEWYCDISGNQEREQTGMSNVRWFLDEHNIHFKYRTSAITYGIGIVRSFVQNGLGQRKFYVVGPNCPKSIDGLRNYSYPEKNGTILNELPIKRDDDACDMVRYFFVNKFDPRKPDQEIDELDRWGKW